MGNPLVGLAWAGGGLAWREAAFGNGCDVVIMKAGLALGCLCARVFFSGFSWVALVLVLESERASERGDTLGQAGTFPAGLL